MGVPAGVGGGFLPESLLFILLINSLVVKDGNMGIIVDPVDRGSGWVVSCIVF